MLTTMKTGQQTFTASIRHNPELSRFEAGNEDEISVLEYKHSDGKLVILHVQVPPSGRGQGIASELTRAALEFARFHRIRVVLRCPFAAQFVLNHPEYAELADPA